MNSDIPTKELTFEQEMKINKLLELYRSNPSNSNKYRTRLLAYINELLSPTLEPTEAAQERE